MVVAIVIIVVIVIIVIIVIMAMVFATAVIIAKVMQHSNCWMHSMFKLLWR